MNIQAVKNELIALKKHATEEEINKLDIGYLNPEDYNLCIYGLMTGNCLNKRAKELLNLSSNIDDFILLPRIVRNSLESEYPIKTSIEESRQQNVSNLSSLLYYISPLENYIMEANNLILHNIIRFLKDEISDINFIK